VGGDSVELTGEDEEGSGRGIFEDTMSLKAQMKTVIKLNSVTPPYLESHEMA
jgi:hypothetical protein